MWIDIGVECRARGLRDLLHTRINIRTQHGLGIQLQLSKLTSVRTRSLWINDAIPILLRARGILHIYVLALFGMHINRNSIVRILSPRGDI